MQNKRPMFGFGDPLKSMSRGQPKPRGFDPRNMGFGDPLKAIANRNQGAMVPRKKSIIESLMAGLKGHVYGKEQ